MACRLAETVGKLAGQVVASLVPGMELGKVTPYDLFAVKTAVMLARKCLDLEFAVGVGMGAEPTLALLAGKIFESLVELLVARPLGKVVFG